MGTLHVNIGAGIQQFQRSQFLSDVQSNGWDYATAVQEAAKRGILQDPQIVAILTQKKADLDRAKAATRGQELQNIYESSDISQQAPTGAVPVAAGRGIAETAGQTGPAGLPAMARQETTSPMFAPVPGTRPGTNEALRSSAAARVNAWSQAQVAAGQPQATVAETNEAQMVAAPKLSEEQRRLAEAAETKKRILERQMQVKDDDDAFRRWELTIKQQGLEAAKLEDARNWLTNREKAREEDKVQKAWAKMDGDYTAIADAEKTAIDHQAQIEWIKKIIDEQTPKAGFKTKKPAPVTEPASQPRRAILRDANGNPIGTGNAITR